MINRTKLQSLTSDTRNTPQALDYGSRAARNILNILTTDVKHISMWDLHQEADWPVLDRVQEGAHARWNGNNTKYTLKVAPASTLRTV